MSLGAFPAMIPGGGKSVAGELYEVDGPTLSALDHLEGHPHFYRRERIRLENGEEVLAYLLTREQAGGRVIIKSGNWKQERKERAS